MSRQSRNSSRIVPHANSSAVSIFNRKTRASCLPDAPHTRRVTVGADSRYDLEITSPVASVAKLRVGGTFVHQQGPAGALLKYLQPDASVVDGGVQPVDERMHPDLHRDVAAAARAGRNGQHLAARDTFAPMMALRPSQLRRTTDSRPPHPGGS